MKHKIMTWIASKLPKNKIERRHEYPQTWWYMPKKMRWIRRVMQWGCKWVGGHEISKTEWEYGGGDFAIRRCRWCDAPIKVPRESIRFQFKGSPVVELMDNVEGENG